MAFPQTPLDVRVELYISGQWQDVTDDVYTAEKISISRGRADEGNRTDPGKCTLTFNNGASKVAPGVSGRYAPRNPLSDLYGQIGRNTPIRVSVPGPTAYLELDGDPATYATTPDTAVLDITGDLDLRWEGEANWNRDGAQVLLGKWEPSGNQKAYMLRLQDGTLLLHHSTDGFTGGIFSQALPALPERAALRATLDIDNGAGGRTARFYWAQSIDGPWTQFGDPVTNTGTTATYASTAPLRIAPTDLTVSPERYPAAGRVYKAEVRNGIDGTVVAAPDFTAQTPGTTGFTDSAGLVWTLAGTAVISDRRIRFTGEVPSWPARWDVSGKDVRVPVEAAGVLRRYGQGAKPLDSTLRRRIPSGDPLVYWPMEDGAEATQASSAVSGGQPLRVSGLTFAGSDYPAGSNPLPTLGQAASLDGRVPGAQAGGWHVEMVYKLGALPATEQTMLAVNLAPGTGGVVQVRARISTAGIRVQGLDADGNVVAFFVFSGADALADFTGVWNRLQIYSAASGSNAYLNVAWLNVVDNTWWNARTTYVGTPGTVTGIKGSWGPDFQGMAIGHLAAFDVGGTTAPAAGVTIYGSADDGYRGESAGTRMIRLASEEGIPVTVYGELAGQERMGPQRPETMLALLDEAADVDGGILLERRNTLGLAYRDRVSLYNQTPALRLDYTAPGHVAPPLEPVDDDQKVRNDVTVSRDGGASARVTLDTGALSTQAPPDGVGVYDESATLNLYDDDQPAQHAGWLVHLGTVDEARYPVVNLDLAAAPSLTDLVTALESGDRVQIANPPAWLPPGPIDLIVQGYTEVLGHPNDWDFSLNCTPASPWNVGYTDHLVYGRADTAGSELAAGATTTATSLTVATTSGPVWVQGRVLNPNPVFEADLADWSAAGAAIDRVATPDGAPFGGSWSMRITPDGVTALAQAVSGMVPVTAGTSYRVQAYLLCAVGRGIDLNINWFNAGFGYLATSTVNHTVTANEWTQYDGTFTAPASAAYAQIVPTVTGTPPASNQLYVDMARLTGATDTGADNFPFDISVGGEVMTVTAISGTSSPQTFTVIRAVNGIVKAQPAGADLRLAQPSITAL